MESGGFMNLGGDFLHGHVVFTEGNAGLDKVKGISSMGFRESLREMESVCWCRTTGMVRRLQRLD